MDLVTCEAPLDNSFQKDRRELVNKGSLGRRRKPSRSNLKQILSPSSDQHDVPNCHLVNGGNSEVIRTENCRVKLVYDDHIGDSCEKESVNLEYCVKSSNSEHILSFENNNSKDEFIPVKNCIKLSSNGDSQRFIENTNNNAETGTNHSRIKISTNERARDQCNRTDNYEKSLTEENSVKLFNGNCILENTGYKEDYTNDLCRVVVNGSNTYNTDNFEQFFTEDFCVNSPNDNRLQDKKSVDFSGEISSDNYQVKVLNGNINKTINCRGTAETNHYHEKLTNGHTCPRTVHYKEDDATNQHSARLLNSNIHKTAYSNQKVASENYRNVIASINRLNKVNGDDNSCNISAASAKQWSLASREQNEVTKCKQKESFKSDYVSTNDGYQSKDEGPNHEKVNSGYPQSRRDYKTNTIAKSKAVSHNYQYNLNDSNQQRSTEAQKQQNVITFSNNRKIITSTPVQNKNLVANGKENADFRIESSLPRTSDIPNLVAEAQQFSVEAKLRRKKESEVLQGRSAVLIQTWERRTQSSENLSKVRKDSITSHNNRFGNCENTTTAMPDSSICSKYKGSLQNGHNLPRDDWVPSVRDAAGKGVISHQGRPTSSQSSRPFSSQVMVSERSSSGQSKTQEPEWVSLSKKLCAKYVKSHIESNSSASSTSKEQEGVAETIVPSPQHNTKDSLYHFNRNSCLQPSSYSVQLNSNNLKAISNTAQSSIKSSKPNSNISQQHFLKSTQPNSKNLQPISNSLQYSSKGQQSIPNVQDSSKSQQSIPNGLQDSSKSQQFIPNGLQDSSKSQQFNSKYLQPISNGLQLPSKSQQSNSKYPQPTSNSLQPKIHSGYTYVPTQREDQKKKMVVSVADDTDNEIRDSNGPPWIHLSRKLCNKFIEEHIECPPITNGHNVEVPELVAPNGDVRIIEKVGQPKGRKSKHKDCQPEWVSLSKKLRAKFIESHIDDPETVALDNQLNASDPEETSSGESLTDVPQQQRTDDGPVYKNSRTTHEAKQTRYGQSNDDFGHDSIMASAEKECCWEYQEMEFDQESNSGTFQETEFSDQLLQEDKTHRGFLPHEVVQNYVSFHDQYNDFETPEFGDNDVNFAPHNREIGSSYHRESESTPECYNKDVKFSDNYDGSASRFHQQNKHATGFNHKDSKFDDGLNTIAQNKQSRECCTKNKKYSGQDVLDEYVQYNKHASNIYRNGESSRQNVLDEGAQHNKHTTNYSKNGEHSTHHNFNNCCAIIQRQDICAQNCSNKESRHSQHGHDELSSSHMQDKKYARSSNNEDAKFSKQIKNECSIPLKKNKQNDRQMAHSVENVNNYNPSTIQQNCYEQQRFNNDVKFSNFVRDNRPSSVIHENKHITVQFISRTNEDKNHHRIHVSSENIPANLKQKAIHGSFFNLSTWDEAHHKNGRRSVSVSVEKDSLYKELRSKSCDNLFDSLDDGLISSEENNNTRENRPARSCLMDTSPSPNEEMFCKENGAVFCETFEPENETLHRVVTNGVNAKYIREQEFNVSDSDNVSNKTEGNRDFEQEIYASGISESSNKSESEKNVKKCETGKRNSQNGSFMDEYLDRINCKLESDLGTKNNNRNVDKKQKSDDASLSVKCTCGVKEELLSDLKDQENLNNCQNVEKGSNEIHLLDQEHKQNADKKYLNKNSESTADKEVRECENKKLSSKKENKSKEQSKSMKAESSSEDEIIDKSIKGKTCALENSQYENLASKGKVSEIGTGMIIEENYGKISNDTSRENDNFFKYNGMIPNSIYNGLSENKISNSSNSEFDQPLQHKHKEPQKLGMSKWITVSKSDQSNNKAISSVSQKKQKHEFRSADSHSENSTIDNSEVKIEKRCFEKRYSIDDKNSVSSKESTASISNRRQYMNEYEASVNDEAADANMLNGSIRSFDMKNRCKSLCDISFNDSSFQEELNLRQHESLADLASTLKASNFDFQHFQDESEIPLCAKLVSSQDGKKGTNNNNTSVFSNRTDSPCVSENSHVYEDMFKETPSGPSDSEVSSWTAIKNNSYYVNGRSSSMNDLDYSDSCSMSVKCDYASSSENSTLQSRHSSYASSSFYVNLRDYDSHMLEPSLSKGKRNNGKSISNGNLSAMSKGNPPTPESLRHLFTSPPSAAHPSANRTARLINRVPSDPQSHYYSTAAATSSAFKHGFEPTPPKPKKAERSSSIKIKDIAHGIILTFKRFQNHSKHSNVSPTHYVDVSHLAEMNDSRKHETKKDKKSQKESKKESRDKGYWTEKTDTDSGFLSDAQRAKARRSSSDLTGLKSNVEIVEKKKSKSSKKNSNREKGKKVRSKGSEAKTIPTVSRKVQQMADGTLYLVTTVSGDTGLPGVYSDSPDTSSELSGHRPVKLPGESNC